MSIDRGLARSLRVALQRRVHASRMHDLLAPESRFQLFDPVHELRVVRGGDDPRVDGTLDETRDLCTELLGSLTFCIKKGDEVVMCRLDLCLPFVLRTLNLGDEFVVVAAELKYLILCRN